MLASGHNKQLESCAHRCVSLLRYNYQQYFVVLTLVARMHVCDICLMTGHLQVVGAASSVLVAQDSDCASRVQPCVLLNRRSL
jgi:hypothetical protein